MATLGLDDSAYRQGVEEAKAQTKSAVSTMSADYNRLYSEVLHLTAAYQKSRKETGATSEETKAFAQKLKEAQAQLNTTAQGLRTAEEYMNSFGDAASGSSKSLAGAIAQGTIMAGFFSKLSSAALAAAKSLIQSGIEYNAQIESYRVGLTNMLGSAEAAKAAMDAIQEDAARTPFDVASLTQANQLLISAGENAGYSRKVIMALGDAVSATGGGNAELSRMSANLQQIANVGKASAIDIKQFAYAGINIYQVLADYTGKSVQEVQKMTISYDLLSQALIAASEEGGRYYNAMDTQSQTMNGRVSTLKDNVSQLAGLMTGDLSSGIGVVIGNLNNMVVAAQDAYKKDGWKGLGEAILGLDNPISTIISSFGRLGSAAVSALDRASYALNKALGKNAYADYDSYEDYRASTDRQNSRDRRRQAALNGVGISNKSWSERQAELAAAAGTGGSSITTSPSGSSGGKKSKSTTETVISSISRTATTTAQNALGTVTTSIQTLTEKVKDSAGSIKDRITETTTTTGKEMVNGIETTYKQVETKVNGVVTKTTKTYDDMSKTLAATLTRTTSKVEGGVTTAIQEVTKKYADGSEHIEKTETITEENIVDGVARTTKTINTYIDGVLQNTKVDTEEAEKSIQAALSRTEKYISEIQGQSDKGIFGLVKSLFTDIKNKDGKAIAGDVVKVIFGQVTQEQRNTILKWADDAMTAINEHYAQGGIQGALQSIADLFSNGITPAVNGSTKEVQSFAAAMKGLSGTGGSGGIVSSILKLFGGGTKAAAAAGEAGAGQAIASAAGGAASFFPECLAVLAVIAEGVVGFKMGQNARAREDSGEERSLGSKLLSGALLAATGPVGWLSYFFGKKFGKKSSSSSAAAESASSGAMSYLDIQDAYWYGNERAFAGYDYRSDPFTYNPNNNSVPKYQAEIQAQLAKLSTVVEQYLPDVANQQIVLDDGTIVGALAPGMNDQLGHIQMLAERGN
nr:MAG TPA: tail tape measure protein [Caudoviricetes sp.]